ncbi:MAG: hypothetical protein MHM6MM_000743 [Cercozoa sp. M6MM]
MPAKRSKRKYRAGALAFEEDSDEDTFGLLAQSREARKARRKAKKKAEEQRKKQQKSERVEKPVKRAPKPELSSRTDSGAESDVELSSAPVDDEQRGEGFLSKRLVSELRSKTGRAQTVRAADDFDEAADLRVNVDELAVADGGMEIESDEEAEERRRELLLRAEAAAALAEQESEISAKADQEPEDESESGYDSDTEESESDEQSEEEVVIRRPTIAPTFVSRQKREKMKHLREQTETVKAEALAEALRQHEQQREQQRRNESDELVLEALKRQREIEREERRATALDSEVELPSSDEDMELQDVETEQSESIEQWRQRELQRVRAMLLAEKERLMDLVHRLRRRLMTDEELERDYAEKRIEHFVPHEKRGHMGYMQKYYHAGVFYQDESGVVPETLMQRDFTQATGLDKIYGDKTRLPEIMQKREYGKKSQSKHTHLRDVDTSVKEPRDLRLRKGGFQSSGSTRREPSRDRRRRSRSRRRSRDRRRRSRSRSRSHRRR